MVAQNLRLILDAAQSDGHELELIAVNDGSEDNSASQIMELSSADNRVRLISFTRNFGKEAAIEAGLANATGEACIVLDADLQHPPHLIPKMLQCWREGYLVVDGVKASRGKEGFGSRLYAKLFYAVFSWSTGLDIENQSDFKLLDRTVVDAYLALPERHRFFRGLIHWARYPSTSIQFDVAARAGGGESQWTQLKLLRYAVGNITSFSSLPLKLVGFLGLLVLCIGTVVAVLSLVQKIQGHAIDGFTTVILLVTMIGGAILLALGIIGHYIGRIYDEIKNRPTYLIKPVERK